jgi:uncharacterized protein
MIWPAFILGLGGSLHCASMCGPLVFSVQKSYDLKGLPIGIWVYHISRIVAYMLLAFLLSLIRLPVNLFGWQQHLSLISGLLLLLLVFKDNIPFIRKPLSYVSTRLSESMVGAKRYKSSLPILGFLNGLLPCGLSYSAAALSVSYGGVNDSILFMAIFGIGTLPMFLVASYFGNALNGKFRFNINRYMKYALGFTAVLLVIRGAGLGIPYLSPSMDVQTSEVSCCDEPE